ncbi:lysostaphin resistance A-like protein [Halosimplex sp. TS25]|uniref:CPBP family intramembrane glutamic endopeptidase n=1 Tax=Halosimplex rarum TaxID=3396619 RepID=UPI0039ED3ABB
MQLNDIVTAVVLSVLPLVVIVPIGALAYSAVGERVRGLVPGIVLMEGSFLLVAVGYLWFVGGVNVRLGLLSGPELVLALALVPAPFALSVATERVRSLLDAEGEKTLNLSRESVPAALIVALVLVGPAEELLYRGIVQPLLVDSLGAVAGIGVMATLFGAVHYPSYGADSPLDVDRGVVIGCLSTGLVGAGLGALFVVTGSLLAPIVTHSLYDAALFAKAAVENDETGEGPRSDVGRQ